MMIGGIASNHSRTEGGSAMKSRKQRTPIAKKTGSGPAGFTFEPKTARQVPLDMVDEEGMESFPASDPPGRLRSRTGTESEPRRPTDADV
jgi:hypothetical protein